MVRQPKQEREQLSEGKGHSQHGGRGGRKRLLGGIVRRTG